jgi:hypothetical protein
MNNLKQMLSDIYGCTFDKEVELIKADGKSYKSICENYLHNYSEKIESIRLTKTWLKKNMAWSTSRYNIYRKSNVINKISLANESVDDCLISFYSGCYSQKSIDLKVSTKVSSDITFYKFGTEKFIFLGISEDYPESSSVKIFKVAKNKK